MPSDAKALEAVLGWTRTRARRRTSRQWTSHLFWFALMRSFRTASSLSTARRLSFRFRPRVSTWPRR
eukprot:5905126-Lingulodinium_polyedra.AAC.1